ncbi:hypothetical protein [Sporomusa sp.]|uniref:hypothetical protein n=1 Tax=Sporomusa sp. TaxID=2078658 RepID=UPI002B513427|nr:hypothetical protein [Sporomusa sp.]HWR42060.1 hypothetical protein [Sporomusa sp.]
MPLMVLVEFADHNGWLEMISKRSKWFTKFFRLPSSAALPAFAGLFIGIVSGSGVILQISKENHYSRATLTILFVMVGICHSLFEETALFVGIGANIFLIAGARIFIALLFAFVIGWLVDRQRNGVMTEKIVVRQQSQVGAGLKQ